MTDTYEKLRNNVAALERACGIEWHGMNITTDSVKTWLKRIASFERPCGEKACKVFCYFVKTKHGKFVPYVADASPHFVDCPAADQFRREKTTKRKASKEGTLIP